MYMNKIMRMCITYGTTFSSITENSDGAVYWKSNLPGVANPSFPDKCVKRLLYKYVPIHTVSFTLCFYTVSLR